MYFPGEIQWIIDGKPSYLRTDNAMLLASFCVAYRPGLNEFFHPFGILAMINHN